MLPGKLKILEVIIFLRESGSASEETLPMTVLIRPRAIVSMPVMNRLPATIRLAY